MGSFISILAVILNQPTIQWNEVNQDLGEIKTRTWLERDNKLTYLTKLIGEPQNCFNNSTKFLPLFNLEIVSSPKSEENCEKYKNG